MESFFEVSGSVCCTALCSNTHVKRAVSGNKCGLVLVCLFRASGKQAADLVLSLWGVELCLYIYLLTPDPPREEERKTRTQTSLGETSLLFFHFLWSALGLCQSLHLSEG